MVYILISIITFSSILVIGWLYDAQLFSRVINKRLSKTAPKSSRSKLPNLKKLLSNRKPSSKDTINISTTTNNKFYWMLNPAYVVSFSFIIVTIAICYWLLEHTSLDVYHATAANSRYNQQVNQLLLGERLKPPPPPPQELFAQLDAEIASQTAQKVEDGYWQDSDSSDVLQNLPEYTATDQTSVVPTTRDGALANSSQTEFQGKVSHDMLATHLRSGHISIKNADRNWKKMNSEFVQRLLAVYKIMNDRYGYEMVLLEGYRSPQRQAKLLAKGPHVTKAGSYRSYHQFGLAADSAFIKNGKIVISERDPWAMRGYKLYGQVAKSMGLTWGGDWRMMDLGHVQLTKKGVLGRPEMARILTSQ